MRRTFAWMSMMGLLGAACAGSTAGGPDGDDDDAATSPTNSATPTPGETPIPCQADADLFDAPWIRGGSGGMGDCATEPDIQVQRVDANTWVLRQSMCTNFEGPFLYLMFGTEKALLEDTGAGGVDVRGTVQAIIAEWLVENSRTSIELVVVNSHGHGDHTAGNASFNGQANTTLVGTSVTAVSNFFGITNWPTEIVPFDLGGRIVDVIPIPGHQTSHIALYDHGTGWLLTGDTLYPGRLYVSDFDTWVTSLDRLVSFTAGKDVCQVMGTHIEMTQTPEVDFDFATTYHPNEHALPLSRAHLVELADAAAAMQANPQVEAHADFIISP